MDIMTRFLKDMECHDMWTDFNIDTNSIVFDLGGHVGRWTNLMYDKYKCTIHTFEPVKQFFDEIVKTTHNIDKIHPYMFGLGDRNIEFDIYVDGDATTQYNYKNTNTIQSAQLKSFTEFCQSNNITHIDVIKINIEGGEYDLLDYLISSNEIVKIDSLVIQFHKFVDNANQRRNAIINKLENTHSCTFSYEFI